MIELPMNTYCQSWKQTDLITSVVWSETFTISVAEPYWKSFIFLEHCDVQACVVVLFVTCVSQLGSDSLKVCQK